MTSGTLVDGVRSFVRDTLVPLESEIEATDEIPAVAIDGMKNLGLFGLTVPREFGGLGADARQEAQIVTELGWTAAAFRSLLGINIGVGSRGITTFGTELQKSAWLPRIATGETVTSFALTESDAGSDATSVATRAVRAGSEWVLNGTKKYVTNSSLAGVVTVIAATQDAKLPGNRHLSAFLLPLPSDGVTVGARRSMLGQRGGYWSDLDLSNVRLPATSLLGREGQGFEIMMSLLDRSRLQVSALAVGQGQRLLHECLTHVATRQQFGKTLGEFELIQALVADSYAELAAMEALVSDTAERVDAGESVAALAAATKLFTSETIGRIADRAVQVFGAEGVQSGSVVERTYRDVRAFRFIEGSTQMQQVSIARLLLKKHGKRMAEHAV